MDSTSWQVTRNIRLLTQKVLRLSSKHNPNALEQAKVFRPQMVGSYTVRKKAGIKLLARLEWLTIWVRAENKNLIKKLIVSLLCGSCHVDRLSNVKIGICLLFCFLLCQKKRITVQVFVTKSLNLFSILKVSKMNFTGTLKNGTTKIIRYSTPISTFTCLN